MLSYSILHNYSVIFILLDSPGSKCGMERGMCSWSNTQNMTIDKLDWELTSAEMEHHYPIPLDDHTLGTEKGKTREKQTTRQLADAAKSHLLSSFSKHPSFLFCKVTSCSFQAAIGQKWVKTLYCWALTCPLLKAPAWSSGSIKASHVRKK